MEDAILKFNPDTVMAVRKMHNLDKPGDIDQLVDVLSDWLKKQHHLTRKEYPRDFLERSILQQKGSVERTKSQIDKICSLRTLLPKFFERCDVKNDFDGLSDVYAFTLLPQLTKQHYRIAVLKILGKGLNREVFFSALAYGIVLCEYIKARDYNDGVIGIFDYRDVDVMEFLSSADLVDIHSLVMIAMHGYALRLKGIHIITKSKAIKTIMETIRKMLGTKVASRFRVHDDLKTLYEYVDRDVLTSEFGGKEKSIVKLDEEWKDVLGSKANIEYLKEMRTAVSNETHRMKESLDVTDLGLAGTFRSLNVD